MSRLLGCHFAPAGLLAACALGAVGCHMAATGQNIEGVRLHQQGQYPAAIQRFQQALSNDPNNADACYNLAAVFHQLGKQNGDGEMLRQAEALYNQCLDNNSQHLDCHRGLAALLVESNRSDRAFAFLKNAVQAHPQNAEFRVELARLYQEFGDLQTAKLQLDQAVQIDQYNARAWRALGALREQTGEYSQALADYQRSFSLDRFQPAVGAKIASLQGAVNQQVFSAAPTDTRMVQPTSPNVWHQRY